MRTIREPLDALSGVLWDGLNVLARHWPALLGWFLLGAIGRRAFLWLAVWTAGHNRTLGVLVLPLAPICALLSLVMMLRTTADSLPAFADLARPFGRSERIRTHLAVAAEVLVPFLAVYASQGLLKADTRQFIFANTADEWMNRGFEADFGRSSIGPGWVLATLVVLALVVRKAIAGFELERRHLGWSALNGYVETLWMITLGTVLTTRIGDIRDWVTSRAVAAGVVDTYHRVVDWLGALGAPVTSVIGWLGDILSSMSTLVVLPIAWLAIGAAVYGSKIPEGGLSAAERRTQQLRRIPSPVRRAVAQGLEPVTTPVKETMTSISRVAAAGIFPMVLFCLVFVLANEVSTGVAWLERWLVGPRDPMLRYALTPYLELAQQAAYFVVSMALLAAAVNRVVSAQPAAEQRHPTETPATYASSGSTA